jgi:myo-inositol-1(or 4)-monophosphatase
LNLQFISDEVVRICEEAGQFQLTHFRQISADKVSDKGLHQLVSFVDVETEKMLVKELGDLVPEAGFITEENTIETNADKDYVWIIDPLDGTTNYLHGLPAFSISVALAFKHAPQVGIVHLPVWEETFAAVKGNGATLNGLKIEVTTIDSLDESLIATGFPYYEFGQMDQYLSVLRQLMKQTHGLRRMGSAAIDLAYTACGRFDGFYEIGLNAWDVAAGALIVVEAGGVVADFSGGPGWLFGKSILASGPGLFPSFRTLVHHGFSR